MRASDKILGEACFVLKVFMGKRWESISV